MTLAQLIPLAIQVSMALIVFCVALNGRFGDLFCVLRRPMQLLRTLAAMHLVTVPLAIVLAVWLDLNTAVELALVASALSPVPPIVPGKELKAGGAPAFVVGTLVVTSLFAIVFVPLAVALIGPHFDRHGQVAPATVATIVGTSVLLPLLAGVLVRAAMPRVADRIRRPLTLVATLLLVTACIPVLIQVWPALVTLIGNYSLLVMVGFSLAGLLAGHVLGGPEDNHRTVLAISAASRHPAVAIAIVHDAPERPEVMAAVLLLLVVGALVSTPYAMWRGRQASTTHGGSHAF
jgi:BASS family bile acid:Na+ symporter